MKRNRWIERNRSGAGAFVAAVTAAALWAPADGWGFTRSREPHKQEKEETRFVPAPAEGNKTAEGRFPGLPRLDKQAFKDPPVHPDIDGWCKEIDQAVNRHGWDLPECRTEDWTIGGRSNDGRPLMWANFGDIHADNTTLILSMTHGDEITPMYVALKLAEWLKENISKYPGAHVVLAPLVNPDGFFIKKPTRVNAKGVDINRNFPTKDWPEEAIKKWKHRYGSNPRRYPGPSAGSEPETRFQQVLIEQLRPKKILSVHAPLGFMDYDGPNLLTLSQFPEEYVKKCLQLRKRLKAVHGGFFPGSLGNYAGQERGIPTLTLELPSADPAKAERYWNRFKSGIETVIRFEVPDYLSLMRREREAQERADAGSDEEDS